MGMVHHVTDDTRLTAVAESAMGITLESRPMRMMHDDTYPRNHWLPSKRPVIRLSTPPPPPPPVLRAPRARLHHRYPVRLPGGPPALPVTHLCRVADHRPARRSRIRCAHAFKEVPDVELIRNVGCPPRFPGTCDCRCTARVGEG